MSIVGMVGRPMPAASDVDLVQASRGGDEEAFEELYRRYHARISAFVRGMVRDDSRAEDVTQEAFVSALRQMRRTQREIQFKPWIYEIARNKAIDAHRRASRSPEVPFEPHGELATQGGVGPSAHHAPEACLMDRERFDNFRGALDELSDTHHRIICLYELEGLSYQEIGVRMQLSSAAVESTLFRARRKLEHEYEQRDTGRRCRAVRAAIARLAEGIDSASDRLHLDRHTRSCWSCRRCAHELGLNLQEEKAPAPRRDARAPAFGERSGSRHDAGSRRVAGPGARHHHKQRRQGASAGDAGSGRRGTPAAGGRSQTPSSRTVPRVDQGGLLPSIPRRDQPVLPRGGPVRDEDGNLPKAPDLLRVPVDLAPGTGQVQGLAPDVAVETPDLGAALPQP